MEQVANQMTKRKLIFLFISVLFVTLTALCWNSIRSKAASITINEINYDDLTLTFNVTDANDIVYYSDSKQKKWEQVIDGDGNENDQKMTMDISWINQKKDYTLTFKTQKNPSILTVVIPAQITDLSVSYDSENNLLKFSNDRGRKIYWRKNNSLNWLPIGTTLETNHYAGSVDNNTAAAQDLISKELVTMYAKGATIYFRTDSKNKTTGDTDLGYRPSKETKFKLSKKAAGPTVKLDKSKFTLTFPANTLYRVKGTTDSYTNSGSKSTTVSLFDIAGMQSLRHDNKGAVITSLATATSIEAKTKGTSSKLESLVSTLEIPLQREALIRGTDPTNVKVDVLGKSSFKITMPDEKQIEEDDKDTVIDSYEYTVVKNDKDIDFETAKWTEVKAGKSATINVTSSNKEGEVFVRIKSNNTDMASAPLVLDIKNIDLVTDANAAFIDKNTSTTNADTVAADKLTFEMIQNNRNLVTDPFYFNINLNQVSSDATVSKISYTDENKKEVTVKFSVTNESNTIRIVKITDISDLYTAATMDKTLPLVITLSTGDTIESQLELVIHTASSVIGGKQELTFTSASEGDFSFTVNSKDYEVLDVICKETGKSIKAIAPSGITIEQKNAINYQRVTLTYNAIKDIYPTYSYGDKVSLTIQLGNKATNDVKEKIEDMLFITINQVTNTTVNTTVSIAINSNSSVTTDQKIGITVPTGVTVDSGVWKYTIDGNTADERETALSYTTSKSGNTITITFPKSNLNSLYDTIADITSKAEGKIIIKLSNGTELIGGSITITK